MVEVSAFVAAPIGGATLAGLGAEVIRVDPLGGGIDSRRWPISQGHSLYWDGLNRGKRSIAVDLRREQGRQLVSRLVTAPGRDAGILLTNLPEREWLSYPRLAAERPDVIVVQIEGNPDGSQAVDYTVNAALGFPWVTGPAGFDEPVNHVLPAWDCMTGFLAATALLAAERRRSREGQGQRVKLSLWDVGLAVAAHLGYLAEAELTAESRKRIGNDLFGSFGRHFRSRDGHFAMVVALTSRQWQALVEATGIGDAVAQIEASLGADLSEEGSRFRHRAALFPLLESWFAARTIAEVEAELGAAGVLWQRYRTFKEMAAAAGARPQSESLLARVEEGELGAHLVPRSPLRFDGLTLPEPGPAPRMGEHTRLVLGDVLHLSNQELEGMAAQGLIG